MLPFEADPDLPPPDPSETTDEESIDEAATDNSAEGTGIADSEVLGEDSEDGDGDEDRDNEVEDALGYYRSRGFLSPINGQDHTNLAPGYDYTPHISRPEDLFNHQDSDVEMTDVGADGEIDYEALMTSDPDVGEEEDDELESDEEDVDGEGDLEEEDEAEKGTGPDLERLVWCTSGCGTNYHKACMNNWVAMFGLSSRLPTCPTCRTVWQID